jgi:hypothetical protein
VTVYRSPPPHTSVNTSVLLVNLMLDPDMVDLT